MSSRNIRRLAAEKEQRERERIQEEENRNNKDNDKENEEPPGEFSPHYVQMNPAYEGLEVSSASESEPAVSNSQYQDEAAAVIPEEDKYGAKKKTYTAAENKQKEKKDKKKKRKNKKKYAKKPEDMDEVEWSLREVNRVLGTPPIPCCENTEDPDVALEKKLFLVRPNQINVNYELAKVFGEEERLRKARPGTRRMRHEIGLSPDVHPFKVKGLTMTLFRTDEDIKYFKFEHTPSYTMRCKALVDELRAAVDQGHVQQRDTNLHTENCVEALLENCDYLYHLEEHMGANKTLEQAIYFMQSVGEPSFNFVDGKTRLEYQFVENRPFHIAVLKYLHILTNIACHRTALELAKVLINLDPTDPLAVIFIIDTLALRAKEYQWLLDLINFWKPRRQAQRLFHMRYSRALAMFHIAWAKKNQEGVNEAKQALMKAIKLFPPVMARIMEYSKIAVSDNIKNHEIFRNISAGHDLSRLMTLYAWFNAPRWRETHVWNWMIDTMEELIELYDTSAELREEVVQNAKLREQIYCNMPTQIKRHLYTIRSMAKYISDGQMGVSRVNVSFNPFPAEGSSTDTYRYFTDWILRYTAPPNAFMALIRGIYPDMYQIGLRSMSQMLGMMEGNEIYTTFGTYTVVGPNTSNPPQTTGTRTYRVLFRRSNAQRSHVVVETEALPMLFPIRDRPVLMQRNAGMARLYTARRLRPLLNQNIQADGNDNNDIPLLNRLDLNRDSQNQTENLDQPEE